MRKLYRGMQADGDRPLIEDSARALGVRVGLDVEPDAAGNVHPGRGLSIAPDDLYSLPGHRRPQEHGGTGRDPVWVINEPSLSEALEVSVDRPEHGVIGPSAPTALNQYQETLADTQTDWSQVWPTN